MMAFHPVKAARTMFGYNAVEDKGRRQAPSKRIRTEDDILSKRKRQRLQATAQDQARNHSLLQWMIERHVSWVADFRTSIRTGVPEVDTVLNRIMRWHGTPKNFDISQRLGRTDAFNLMERAKIVMGDAALVKLDNLKLQAIESDLICKASNYPKDDTTTDEVKDSINGSGLIVGEYGETLQYSICNRGNSGRGYEFDHLEDAKQVMFAACYTRFGSQFRGVSPLASALNTIQDLMEATEWNLIKAKMASLFGVALLRKAGAGGNVGAAGGATGETAGETASEADDDDLTLMPNSINMLDMAEGDDAKVIESTTPSTEFVNGCYLFAQLAMLSLNMPITAFDSRRSSFSARIADLNEYEVAARKSQRQNRYLRQEYSNWLIEEIWNGATDFDLKTVATRNNMGLRDVQEAIEWIPAGAPWLDKLKQVKGDELAIEVRLDNAVDASKRRGSDAYGNVDKQLALELYEKEQREDKGLVPVETELSVDAAIGRVVTLAMAKAADEQSEQESDDDEK